MVVGKSPDFDSTCCSTVGIMDNVCDSYEPINDGEAVGLRQSFRVKLHRWVNADGNMISNVVRWLTPRTAVDTCVTVEKNNLVSGLALFAELAHDAVCRPEARERAHSAILLECACPARRDLRLLFPSRLAARLV